MARGWFAVTAAVALALSAGGCSPAQSGSTATGTPSGTQGTSPQSSSAPASETACVADPEAVIGRALPAAASGAMPADKAAALDKAAQDGFSKTSAAGVIVAVRSPEGTWIKALGLADEPTNTPMTEGMYLRIGSVTKTFTGTLILQLAQDGKLSIEDPIGKYLPDIPHGDEITVRMLLNMTSGIASYSLDPTFQQEIFSNPTKQWNPDDLIAMGLALPRQFEPGSNFDYSNTNTLILGRLIEKVSGTTYADALKTNIFDPLGLTGTSLPGSDGAMPLPHPTGLTLQGLPDGELTPQDATAWNPSWGWAAGALTSTAADMLTYGRALGTGQGLLDRSTQALRFAAIPGPAGYGLAVGCIDGWFGHTGEIPGFNTALYYDTRTDTTVAILANSDILTGSCSQSPTLPGNPADLPCIDPAGRVLIEVSAAVGHAFTPNTKS